MGPLTRSLATIYHYIESDAHDRLIKRNILGFMYKSQIVDFKTKISIYLFKQHSSNNIILL